jgi:hypothetical protein
VITVAFLNTLFNTLLPGVLPDGDKDPEACFACVLEVLSVSEKPLPAAVTAGVTGELSAVGASQLLLLLLLLEVLELNVFLVALVLRCCRLSRPLSFAVAPTFKLKFKFEFTLRFPALPLPLLLLLCSGDVE